MKHISVWKVFILTIITLGIYFIVWCVKRREELVAAESKPIPSWLWLLLPLLISGFIGMVALIIGLVALSGDPQAAWIFMQVLVPVIVLIPIAFSLWWMWRFGAVAADAMNQRITRDWIFVLYLITGPAVILFLQYYFNRPADKATTPSKNFIVLASATCLVFAILNVWSLVDTYTQPGQYEEFATELRKINEEIKADTQS